MSFEELRRIVRCVICRVARCERLKASMRSSLDAVTLILRSGGCQTIVEIFGYIAYKMRVRIMDRDIEYFRSEKFKENIIRVLTRYEIVDESEAVSGVFGYLGDTSIDSVLSRDELNDTYEDLERLIALWPDYIRSIRV